MMKWLPLILLTGCMSNDGLRTMSMSQDNIWNLSRLCIGMNESQVLQIMHYPYSKKTIETTTEMYQIWFYVTKPSGLGQSRLVRQNLTPLTFENGILKGWGYEFYQYTLKKLAPRQEEPSKPHDGNSLEKAIEETEATSANESTPQNPSPKKDKPKKDKPKKEDKDPLDKEDENMINDGEDQNFNFW